ncbi:MAG: ABC transporter permease [Clostridiales bacterium]|nr:ABC transporter permease [Clostridiales bacterium]
MSTYIIRRLFHSVIIILIVSLIVFLLLRALPGDPIMMLIAQNTNMEWTPEMIEALRDSKGLNDSLPVQYFRWFSMMLRGDFGVSIMHNYNIGEQLKSKVVVSMMLGICSFAVSIIVGPLLGIISAIRRGKFIDNVVTIFANIGITAPQFWIAILLIFLFSMRLQLLPIYGYTLPWVNLGLCIRQSILPVFVTALGPIASTARQTRSSVLEVLGEDYVRTAWAKGMNERKVLMKHVLKNSLMPIVTLQGTMLRQIVGGSVVVERVFVIPGMGKFMVDAMQGRDYTVVQSVTVVMTLVVVISYLIVDLLYGWVDPRIQYD